MRYIHDSQNQSKWYIKHTYSHFSSLMLKQAISLVILSISFPIWAQNVPSISPPVDSQTRDLLLNPPQLHQPYEYTPKIYEDVKVSVINQPLINDTITHKKLSLTVDPPSYLSDELVLRWNMAMISPLQVGQTPKFNIELSPHIEGSWRWQGTQSITFSPKKRWRKSTRYKVLVNGPMQSVSGQTLGPYFKLSRLFSTKTNRVRYSTLQHLEYRNQKPHLAWTEHLSNDTIIQVCFQQQTKSLEPLSLFSLRKKEGQTYGQNIRLEYAVLDQSLQRDRCVYLKAVDTIDPFSTYTLTINKGISSDEGPLVSSEVFVEDYNSQPRLKLTNLYLRKRVLNLSFNLPLSEKLLYENVVIYPAGMDPNQLSSAEISSQNLLDDHTSKVPTPPRVRKYHEVRHHVAPNLEVDIWIRPEAIKSSPQNSLLRSSLSQISKTANRGYEWTYLKTIRPDLGYIVYEELPSVISVEQVNQPSQKLNFYGMDHLCMQWYSVSAEQLAKYDLMNTINTNSVAAWSLPITEPELCVDLFDPKYIVRRQSFPIVPYRYAVSGNPQTWSFGSNPLPTTKAVSRPPLGSSTKVSHNCKEASDPCQIHTSTWKSFYDWANQKPSIQSGSGSQFFILKQKWHWTPKIEDISAHSYGGVKGLKGQRYFINHSLVQATRYGMIAKLNDHGGQVWIWDLFSDHPISQAKVRVYSNDGTLVADSSSTNMGLATFQFDHHKIKSMKAHHKGDLRYYIIADVNGDYGFVSSHHRHKVRRSYYDYYDYYGHSSDQTRGELWTERGIYRPGDSVHVGGTLAQVTSNGVEPLRQAQCKLILKNNKGTTEENRTVTSSALGGVTTHFRLSAKAELGTYQVIAQCEQAHQKTLQWRHEFRVAHFRRPTFRVDAYTAQSQALVETPLSHSVQGHYLYGSPMVNKSWNMFVEYQRQEYTPKNKIKVQHQDDPSTTLLDSIDLSQFTFGTPNILYYSGSVLKSSFSDLFPSYQSEYQVQIENTFGTGNLDHQGKASKTIHPVIHDYVPYQITSTWTITDSDSQTMTASSKTTVHPTDRYIGLRSPNGHYTSLKDALSIELISIDPLSNSLAISEHIEVSLLQEKWVKISLKDEIGRDQVENQQRLVKIGECKFNQINSLQKCTLQPVESGRHIWVARHLSSNKKEAYTILKTYVYGHSGSWKEHLGQRVELKLTSDKPKIGGRLGILIQNPFPEAEAWITIERERILYSKRQRIGGSDMIYVPITEDMGPNAWVKVVVTRPRSHLPYLKNPTEQATTEDKESESQSTSLGQPIELYGEHEFSVQLTPAELDIQLQPDQLEKRPGDPLNIHVSMRDKTGQPASGEVFVWALDEGVARLTGYQVPNLLASLHSNRHNQVHTLSHLKQLVDHQTMGNKGYPVGGGGYEAEGQSSMPRSNFKATPFFVGMAKVDESGKTVISRKLTDDLTTFRLYAVGVSERTQSNSSPNEQRPYLLRAGTGQSKVVVNLPLMIRPALPRTLTVGDRFNAGAVVSSLLTTEEKVRVKIELSGPVKLLGSEEKTLIVAAHNNRLVQAPYQVDDLGVVKVKLTLYRNQVIEDVTTTNIEVKAPAQPEHYVQQGDLVAESTSEPSHLTIDLRPPDQPAISQSQHSLIPPIIPADLQVSFGVSVMDSLFGETIALLEYPYGCLEQRSSRILPFALAPVLNLPIQKYLNGRQKHKKLAHTEVSEVIHNYFKTIAQMQTDSGGIRYWLNLSSGIHIWANIYAYMVINELRKSGYTSDLININKLLKYLKKSRSFVTSLKQGEYKVSPDTSAFLTFTLSEYDQPLYALEEHLLGHQDQLNLNAKLLLSASLAGPLNRQSQGPRLAQAKVLFKDAMRSFHFDGERIQVDQDHSWAWWSFDSDRRKLALALIAMLRVDPDNDLVLPLLRGLAQTTKNEQRLNTQAAAFALLAIRDYLKVRESITPNLHIDLELLTLQQGQKSTQLISTHDIKGFDSPMVNIKRQIHLADQAEAVHSLIPVVEGLHVKASGQGRLYYGSRITQYPNIVRLESLNRGYGLERLYTLELPSQATKAQLQKRLNPNLSQSDIKQLYPQSLSYQVGDLITVKLILHVPHTARYLVINDPLPSGLEIVDPSLKGAQTRIPKGKDESSWHLFDHVELRDDRVLLFADKINKGTYEFSYLVRATTSGRFIRPAAVVEEMYDPQHAGRSDGGHLWIQQKPSSKAAQ